MHSKLLCFSVALTLLLILSLSACDGAWAPAATSADPNVGGGRAVIVAQMPTPDGTAVPVKQAVRPGSVVSTGSLTFTLNQVQTQNNQTEITYQLQGLPANYADAPAVGMPWIVLLNGEIVPAVEGLGGGSPAAAASAIQFPALPAGTREFTLVIPNRWTGSPQTWYLPVNLQ